MNLITDQVIGYSAAKTVKNYPILRGESLG